MSALSKCSLLVCIMAVFTSACGNCVVLPPNDINTVANEGNPVYATLIDNPNLGEALTTAILNAATNCPLNNSISGEALASHGITEEAVVTICNGYEDIITYSVYITAAMSIPATLEPSYAGELTQGGVFVGGKMVAWIFVGTGLVVAGASVLFGDIISEIIWENTSEKAPDWAIPFPNENVIQELESPKAHARENHDTLTNCVVTLLRNGVNPLQVFYSQGAPQHNANHPRLAFTWGFGRALRDLGPKEGCENTEEILRSESKGGTSPDQIRIILVVGYKNGTFFAKTNYIEANELFQAQLCYWNFHLQVFPTVRGVACGGVR